MSKYNKSPSNYWQVQNFPDQSMHARTHTHIHTHRDSHNNNEPMLLSTAQKWERANEVFIPVRQYFDSKSDYTIMNYYTTNIH